MTRDHLYSSGNLNAAANRRVAEWLAQNTPLESTVYVWGFEPVIYDLSDRRPATSYIYNVSQRVEWARELSREILMHELKGSRPAAIVVARGDIFPNVTGNYLDSFQALQQFPELERLLRTEYRPVKRIEDLEILLRGDL